MATETEDNAQGLEDGIGLPISSLPPLDLRTNTNHAPHLVILGAGASLAAFPQGDAFGRKLPLMKDLIEVLGLEPLLRQHGITDSLDDFELLYDRLATSGAHHACLNEVESCVHKYFAAMRLPEEVTLYDLLLLSLREKDVVATFNWDPFLALAYRRNAPIRRLPKILFLHGNVEVGACLEHRRVGFVGRCCSLCGRSFEPSRLLFPIRQKNYASDPLVRSQWDELECYLRRAYLVTFFGYSAPMTDAEARRLLLRTWRENPMLEQAEVEIIDIQPEKNLEANWSEFFVRQHYAILTDIHQSLCLQHVRRSCEAFAMATLQQKPWRDNPFPELSELSSVHRWLAPLLREEEEGHLSNTPCRAERS